MILLPLTKRKLAVSFSPEFKGPIEGYVINFINRHYWKVQRSIPREDLVQEAAVVFLRCKRKYLELENAAQFMALFKTAWARHFIDLANEDTASRILVQQSSLVLDDGGEYASEVQGDSNHDGELATMLRQAPREVNLVLNLFLNAPQELLDVALGSWKGRDRRCVTGGSKRICQLLGLPEDFDALKAVEDYFTP